MHDSEIIEPPLIPRGLAVSIVGGEIVIDARGQGMPALTVIAARETADNLNRAANALEASNTEDAG